MPDDDFRRRLIDAGIMAPTGELTERYRDKNDGPETFSDVDFPTEYPAKRVAEHEVFMSFNDDDDAVAFRDWWAEVGAEEFQDWLNKSKEK